MSEYRGFTIRSAAFLRVAVEDSRIYDIGPLVGYFSSPERAYAAIDAHLDKGWPLGGGSDG